jgi:hypothetical protein
MANVCLAAGLNKVIDSVETYYKNRCNVFNTSPIANKLFENHSKRISNLLGDEKKVNAKEHAGDEEKKTIFKAIMATRFQHNSIRFENPLTDKTNKLYWHFQIIHLVDELSEKFVAHMNKNQFILQAADFFADYDLKILCEYSGVKQGWFFQCFEEAFHDH